MLCWQYPAGRDRFAMAFCVGIVCGMICALHNFTDQRPAPSSDNCRAAFLAPFADPMLEMAMAVWRFNSKVEAPLHFLKWVVVAVLAAVLPTLPGWLL